ncbi:MAG: nucleoside monophosphate kinase, partial [Endomicrobia bacterium]|nr:nucleoside monophosphate kinase [Endomicrobiia bacterium]
MYFRKILAAFLSAILIFSFVLQDYAYAVSSAAEMPAAGTINPVNDDLIQGIGKVVYGKDFGGDVIVFNIQDFHMHPEVQKNISLIIDAFDKKYSLKNVYVEGAYGNVDIGWLTNVKDNELKNSVLENMLASGDITGTEYFAASKNKGNFLLGLEDKKIHRGNIKRLGTLIEKKPFYETSLNSFENELEAMQTKYLNSGSKRLNALIKKYRNGGISSEKYYRVLLSYMKKNAGQSEGMYGAIMPMNIEDYPNISTYLKITAMQKKLNYKTVSKDMQRVIDAMKENMPFKQYRDFLMETDNLADSGKLAAYLSRMPNDFKEKNFTSDLFKFVNMIQALNEINPVFLIKEERLLVENIRIALSKNNNELEISFLSGFFIYFCDYMKASIASDDYAYFKSRFPKFLNLWKKYSYYDTMSPLQNEFDLIDEYYAVNDNRNDIFINQIAKNNNLLNKNSLSPSVKNTVSGFAEGKKNIIVCVTGGYHSEGLAEILEKRNVSYAVITPNVNSGIESTLKKYDELALAQAMIFNQSLALALASQSTIPEMTALFMKSVRGYFSGIPYTQGNIDAFVNELKNAIGQENVFADYSAEKTVISVKDGVSGEFMPFAELKTGKESDISVEILLKEGERIRPEQITLILSREKMANYVKTFYDMFRLTIPTGLEGFAFNADRRFINLMEYAAKNNLVSGNGLIFDIADTDYLPESIIGVETKLIGRLPDFVQNAVRLQGEREKAAGNTYGFLKILLAAGLLSDFIPLSYYADKRRLYLEKTAENINSSRLVFLGAPLAGKGTTAGIISDALDIPHIASGDIVRGIAKLEKVIELRARKANSEKLTGEENKLVEIAELSDSGQLISDDDMNALVFAKLDETGYENGFILDGYPRTLGQAKALDEFLKEKGISVEAVFIDIELDSLPGRLKERVARAYEQGIEPRADDNPETLKARIEEFKKTTLPVIDYYGEKGSLIQFQKEESGSSENIADAVVDRIDESALLELPRSWAAIRGLSIVKRRKNQLIARSNGVSMSETVKYLFTITFLPFKFVKAHLTGSTVTDISGEEYRAKLNAAKNLANASRLAFFIGAVPFALGITLSVITNVFLFSLGGIVILPLIWIYGSYSSHSKNNYAVLKEARDKINNIISQNKKRNYSVLLRRFAEADIIKKGIADSDVAVHILNYPEILKKIQQSHERNMRIPAGNEMRQMISEIEDVIRKMQFALLEIGRISESDKQAKTYADGRSEAVKSSRMVFLGPPLSGKSSAAKIISAVYNIPEISTGDLLLEKYKSLAESIKRKTGELSPEDKKILNIVDTINAGGLVDDDVVIDLVHGRLRGDDTKNGFILDGFPRTVRQAEALEKMLFERNEFVTPVLIDADWNTVEARRNIISDEEANADDSQESLIKRYDNYIMYTLPVIDHYRNKYTLAEFRVEDIGSANPSETIAYSILAKLREIYEADKKSNYKSAPSPTRELIKPSALSNGLIYIVPEERTGAAELLKDAVIEHFPNISGQPVVEFKRGVNAAARAEVSKTAVMFSGGPASGGNNVLAGIYDAFKEANPGNEIYGVYGGPGGLVNNQMLPLSDDLIDRYRNTGGFDSIGTGRAPIGDKELGMMKANLDANGINALVIIGGDGSNTLAAVFAEYLKKNGSDIKVIGVPKTLDGDVKFPGYVETSFGFDTGAKTYAATVSNLATDARSTGKYWHAVKVMGRNASHVTLEVALQTHPNIALISEEILDKKLTLNEVVESIVKSIADRSADNKDYGVILIPEGLLDFIPELKILIDRLNDIYFSGSKDQNFTNMNQREKSDFMKSQLSGEYKDIAESLPEELFTQLAADRDATGKIHFSRIDTAAILMDMVEKRLAELKSGGKYEGNFEYKNHFVGYEGRSTDPSNFDNNYAYALGLSAAALVANGYSGYMAYVTDLQKTPKNWRAGGVPLTNLMEEGRNGPRINQYLVDLNGPAFRYFAERRDRWSRRDDYITAKGVQLTGYSANSIPVTLQLELKTNTSKQSLVDTQAWKELLNLFMSQNTTTIADMFESDPGRTERMTMSDGGIFVDFSKNPINVKTASLLLRLARESGVLEKVNGIISGSLWNRTWTGQRAVLHTALRNMSDMSVFVDDKDIMPQIREVLAKIKDFSDAVISGANRSVTGQKYTDVVSIYDGSDLGIAMAAQALSRVYGGNINVHFVSNTDPAAIWQTISHLNPASTLIIIEPKTFDSPETLQNARLAKIIMAEEMLKQDTNGILLRDHNGEIISYYSSFDSKDGDTSERDRARLRRAFEENAKIARLWLEG